MAVQINSIVATHATTSIGITATQFYTAAEGNTGDGYLVANTDASIVIYVSADSTTLTSADCWYRILPGETKFVAFNPQKLGLAILGSAASATIKVARVTVLEIGSF